MYNSWTVKIWSPSLHRNCFERTLIVQLQIVFLRSKPVFVCKHTAKARSSTKLVELNAGQCRQTRASPSFYAHPQTHCSKQVFHQFSHFNRALTWNNYFPVSGRVRAETGTRLNLVGWERDSKGRHWRFPEQVLKYTLSNTLTSTSYIPVFATPTVRFLAINISIIYTRIVYIV